MGSFLEEGRILQAEYGTVLWAGDLTGKQEEIETEFLQSERLPVWLQAGSLECRDEVVSQADNLQVEGIRRKRTRGDFRQGEVLAQLPEAPFHGRAAIVEMPHAGGSQRQIGHPSAIEVRAPGEERRWGFRFRNKSSGDHETTGFAPTLGAMFEVGHFPVAVNRLIAQAGPQVSEGPTEAGHDGILSGPGFEGIEHGVKGEACIGAGTNLPDVRRHVGEAGIE